MGGKLLLFAGKWVCDLQLPAARPCVIYSVGSYGDTSFEKAVHKELPQCQIHTFDHTLTPSNTKKASRDWPCTASRSFRDTR